MKSIYLILAVLFIDGTALAEEKEQYQSSPQLVISSFFAFLKKNDEKKLIELLAPLRQKDMPRDIEGWHYWLDLWRRCDVVKFAGAPLPTGSSKYDETVLVPVEYKCVHRPNFNDAIKISRVAKSWYWDEN